MLLWGLAASKVNLRSPRSKPEVTRSKKDFSQFWLIHAPIWFGGLKSEPEVTKVNTGGHKVKNDLFPILADSCSYGGLWISKVNLRSPRSKPEVTRLKK